MQQLQNTATNQEIIDKINELIQAINADLYGDTE